MSQTSYSEAPAAAKPGMPVDTGLKETISRLLSTQRLVQVQITGSGDGTYEIEIDGVVEATFAASANTATEIRDDLLADLQASSAPISAESLSTDSILIEATTEDGFDSRVSGPAITESELVAQGQGVPFGLGVCEDDRQAGQTRLPRQATDITGGRFLGVSRRDSSREYNAGGWPNKSSMSVHHRGRIWVTFEDAVSFGDNVFCRYASGGGGSQLGAFRSDADTNTAAQVPNAKVFKAAGAGELGQIELL